MTKALGSHAVVLHGHLPWVHHPNHDSFLEEDWYFEALTETYLPLLGALERMEHDRIPVRLAVGLTPPLLEMLRSPSLREKSERFLLRRRDLAEREVVRTKGRDPFQQAARHYVERFDQLWSLWTKSDRDPIGLFRHHQDEGRLEILASCATHAVMPLVHTAEFRRTQVIIGVALYEEIFGRKPAGFWLPECAYAPGIDQVLVDAGVQWVILEQHGVLGAHPKPPAGTARPIRTPAGLFAFGRDLASSHQVWAAEVGYPGDPAYRELYRDLGYDAPYSDIVGWLHKDGVRRNVGIKYHRVTGKVPLHEKEPWDPAAARDRARVHAGHFLFSRGEQSKSLGAHLGEAACTVSPYDMELFGHWWYEGPWFLEDIFRQMADPKQRPPVRIRTPGDVLREDGSRPLAAPGLSTWGEGGFLKMWLNEKNQWVLRHQQELERRMIERAREWPDAEPRHARLLNQMLREVLLVQSSDWAFIISRETQVHYARQRVCQHVDRFLVLEKALTDPDSLDPDFWSTLEAEDCLFPGLDYRVILGGAPTVPGMALGTL